jgi:hypothetical protein
VTIRLNDILFYGGGECLQKFAAPVWGLNGRQRVAPTLTRATAVGPFVDQDGKLRRASANRLRPEWTDIDLDGVFEAPTILIETPAFINLVSSDNFDSGWTSVGTPVVTASISDPAGGTSAYRIADNDAGAVEQKYLGVTFTADGVKAVVFAVREATMPASGVQTLSLWDNTAPANRLALEISAWVAGVPTVAAIAGFYLGKWYVGNGYWAIAGLGSVTAANTNRLYITPAATLAQTGSIDVYRVNTYNATSAPRSILNASETKAAEAFSHAFNHKAQLMCGHVRFNELDKTQFFLGNYRVMQIGAAADTDPRLVLYKGGSNDTYFIRYDTGSAVETYIDINPGWGDVIDLFWWLYDDGSVNIAGRKKTPGGSWGSITTGTPSSALTTSLAASAPAWSGNLIHFGSSGVTNQGMMALHRALIARGNHSKDDLLGPFQVAV